MALSPIPADAQRALLAWFDQTGRALPFRTGTDPYAILVSEVMAQQTQVARVGPAWVDFMRAFPGVRELATATPAEVLQAWRGLGYNRRALNLHAAARQIVRHHGGRVPSDLLELEALPGIGQYTARAVAALAFGAAVGPVDTNVRRVLRRVVDTGETASPRELQELADAAVPRDRPGDWTHALMDLGATVCGSRRARCGDCPIRAWCASADAVPDASPRRRRGSSSFTTTSRWLRGRIIDRLRDAPLGAWASMPTTLGPHDAGAVETALGALAREGLIERGSPDRSLVRLATRAARPRAAAQPPLDGNATQQ